MKRILTMVFVFLFLVGFTMAVEPVYVGGNPDCENLGFDHQLKIDPPVSGTYDGITFTLAGNLQYFDWSSTFPIDAVIAKGGNNANVYYYDPASMGDTGLVSPLNNGGQVPALSHVKFCWNNSEEIPEFGVVAAGVALIGALGIFAFRRK